MKKRIFTFISLILVLVMAMMSVTACGSLDFRPSSGDSARDEQSSSGGSDEKRDDKPDNVPNPDLSFMSFEWEDALEETPTFVLGLIATELETSYDVFSGFIELDDGSRVCGLGFSDYETAFEEEGTGRTLFSAGFLSFEDKSAVTNLDVNKAQEIHLYEEDAYSNYGYVYATTIADVTSHCVVFNKYIKYGTKDGVIKYEETPYIRGECDTSLGALYSYDAGRYLYDPEVGSYTPLTGTSLTSSIDFLAIEAEVNRIIKEQDFNFSSQDVETAAYIAVEALQAYLLSLQEETFLGYNVQELIAISEGLDPLESIRFSEDGLFIIDIEPTPPPQPSAFMKWMTGIVCGIAMVGSMALSVFVPALAPLSGSIIGSAVEVFSEVIVQNKTIENVDWRKVGIAAVAGAISANTGIIGDAIIGGITNSAFALLDGGGAVDALISGAMGVGAGIVLGATFKLVSKGISALVHKAAPKFVNKISSFIDDHRIDLGGKFARQVDDVASPRSKFKAQNVAQDAIDGQDFANKIDDATNPNNLTKLKHDIDGIKEPRYDKAGNLKYDKFYYDDIMLPNQTGVDVNDFDNFTFDDYHVNTQRMHNVTNDEAIQFAKEAKIVVKRVEPDGTTWYNYYGANGSVYVNVEKKLIRTAFKADQYNVVTKKLMEILSKYGL